MDGGALGELLYYIIKYGLLLIAIIGIRRWLLLRNDGRKHITTKIITSISIILTLSLFIGSYFEHKSKMNVLAGKYKVEFFKCEKCIECNAVLKNDGTYELIRSQQIIDNGNWDFKERDFDVVLMYDFIFDGQYTYGQEEKSTRTISYIKNTDCRN